MASEQGTSAELGLSYSNMDHFEEQRAYTVLPFSHLSASAPLLWLARVLTLMPTQFCCCVAGITQEQERQARNSQPQ